MDKIPNLALIVQMIEAFFANAKVGDSIKCGDGLVCKVVGRESENPPSLWVQFPGHDVERIRFRRDLGIIDEEWGTIMEFTGRVEFITEESP